MLEIWRAGGSNTGATPELARTVEAEGWDGQMFMDSQCLSADPYAQMGVWACSTERIRMSTGVTNPLTRNLAVTAGAAATIQAISGGRAVLGIGRGDSALAYLGHQTMQGQVGPADAAASENLGKIRQGYDMTEHGNVASKERIVGGALSPDFVKRFAVVGTPDHCFERLRELLALGLERIVAVGPGFYPGDWGEAAGLFAKEVLPALKAVQAP